MQVQGRGVPQYPMGLSQGAYSHDVNTVCGVCIQHAVQQVTAQRADMGGLLKVGPHNAGHHLLQPDHIVLLIVAGICKWQPSCPVQQPRATSCPALLRGISAFKRK